MSDIAVVIPARNAAATLAEALRSVLAPPEVGEVIVVNDGSTDGTTDVARAMDDRRVKIVEGPRCGVAGALNAGFAAATRPFVARCDADDWIAPDRFAWQRDWLDGNRDYIAVSGGFSTVFPDGSHAADLACDGDACDVTQLLRQGTTVTSLCTWLIRTEALVQICGARDWFFVGEDIDLQFRLAERGRVWHDPKIAYFYRLHDTSITHSESSALIEFYGEQARIFARQRCEQGSDALQRGTPPVPPVARSHKNRKAWRAQATGHLIGQAWREFEVGRPGTAYRRLHSATLCAPLSSRLWYTLLVLNAKILCREIGKLRSSGDE